jgi:hypothetical protein
MRYVFLPHFDASIMETKMSSMPRVTITLSVNDRKRRRMEHACDDISVLLSLLPRMTVTKSVYSSSRLGTFDKQNVSDRIPPEHMAYDSIQPFTMANDIRATSPNKSCRSELKRSAIDSWVPVYHLADFRSTHRS